MTPHYTDPLVTLFLGDCLDVMRELPDASVDSVVTDPPYGLEFMGKEWDKLATVGKQPKMGKPTGDPHRRHTGTPAFGANGNPTCRNCGGDKYRNGERKCSCEAPDFGNHAGTQSKLMQAWHEQWATEAFRVLKPGGYLLAFGGTRTYHRLASAIEDAGFEIRDTLMWIYASGFPKSANPGRMFDSSECRKAGTHTDDREHSCPMVAPPEWYGLGSAIKPSHEPIVMARKPMVGTIIANLQRFGTGALNIDGCRITAGPNDRTDYGLDGDESAGIGYHGLEGRTAYERPAAGRWPPNTLLSDPELFDEPNPWVVGSGATTTDGVAVQRNGGGRGIFTGLADCEACDTDTVHTRPCPRTSPRESVPDAGYGGSGGYSRFFIVPKSPRHERNRGLTERSSHPTVKPIDLMRHLVRLVTPPGGVTLDPFLGSGTTALAASEEGFRCIGIEREAEYLEIAVGRLMATPMGLGLETELRGKPARPSLNKPTEWKSDGDGIGNRVAYQNGVGARKAGSIRSGYDAHLMPSKPPKPKADNMPLGLDAYAMPDDIPDEEADAFLRAVNDEEPAA